MAIREWSANGKRTTILWTVAGSTIAAGLMWVATSLGRVRDIIHIERRLDEAAIELKALPDRYTPRVEMAAWMQAVDKRLERIENKLDKYGR